MDGESRDVADIADVDGIGGDAGAELGAFVVFAEAEEFEPVAAVVFERPGHEAKLLWIVIEALCGELGDAAHLLGVCLRINDMPRALRDEIREGNALFGEGFAHDDVRLEEGVFVAYAGDLRHHGGVCGIVHGVEHVQADLLMRWQRADLDEAGDRCFREAMRVHVTAIGADGDEAVRVLQAEVPGA